MNRRSLLGSAVFASLIVCCTADAGSVSPRYRATVLDSFEGGQTTGRSLNDLGCSTGESGSSQVTIGTHAFVGQASGSIENIETLVGYDISNGAVINNQGQVAGEVTVFAGQTGVSRLFRYTPEAGMVDLGTLGGTYGWVIDMNDAGTIIGDWHDGTAVSAFVYSDERGFENLRTLTGMDVRAVDINNAGQVTGYYYYQGQRRAFLWDGVFHSLGALGGPESAAYYLNDKGVVVGWSGEWNETVAFRYDPDQGFQVLPIGPELPRPGALWITNSGLIVGQWWDGDLQRAFQYTDAEGASDLGALSADATVKPIAANDAGHIVLVQFEPSYALTPLVHVPGRGLHDLNACIVGQLDWELVSPADINAAGQILCVGFDGFLSATVLLTPVEPGDLNGDGAVDQSDLGTLLAHYGLPAGATYEQGDIDGDGAVSQSDLGILLAAFQG